MIKGFEHSYDGVGPQANEGFKLPEPVPLDLAARLRRAQRRPARLRAPDRRHLALSGALAARAPDVSALVGNLNRMMNAIGDRKERLASRDRPAARLHAQLQHDRRQPARRPRRRRPAGRRLEAGRASSCSRSSPSCAPPPPTRCRRCATSTRSSSAPAATTTWSSSPSSSRARPRSRSARARPTAAPGTANPERPRDRRRRRLHPGRLRRGGLLASQRLDQPRTSSAPTRPSSSAGSTTSGTPASIDANGGIGRIATTFNPFTRLRRPRGLPGPASPAAQPGTELLADALDTGNDAPLPGRQRAPGSTTRSRRRLDPVHRRRRAHRRRAVDCDPSQVPPGP